MLPTAVVKPLFLLLAAALFLLPLAETAAAMPPRQAPEPTALLEPYIRAGEHAITLPRGIVIDKARYDIHYITVAGGAATTGAQFFQTYTQDALSQRGVRALLVTRNGSEVVTDRALLEKVFVLYNAAYFLYTEPPDEPAPDFKAELALILKNPLFMAMTPVKALAGRRMQTSAALRALLIGQTAAAEAEAAVEQAMVDDPATVLEALNALNQVLARRLSGIAAVEGGIEQLPAPLQKVDHTLQWADHYRRLMRFYYILSVTEAYQQERAQWLDAYAAAFADREGGFDSTELRSLADVLAGVQDPKLQRLQAALEAVLDETATAVFSQAALLSAANARTIAALVAEKTGSTALSGVVGTALSNATFALTVNNLLYGVDDLYASFTIADRAAALCDLFRTGREAMQAIAAQAGTSVLYDGAVVESFRLAWLLERLAHVTALRSYADGIDAAAGRPNLTELLNLIAGRDWEGEAALLREAASEREQDIMARLGEPLWMEDALALAAARTGAAPGAPAVDSSASSSPAAITDARALLDQFLADSARAKTVRIVSDTSIGGTGFEQNMSVDCGIALPAQGFCTGSLRVSTLLRTQTLDFELLVEDDGVYARQRGSAWEDISGDATMGDTLQDLVGQSAIDAFSSSLALDKTLDEIDGQPVYVLRFSIEPYSYARLMTGDAAAAVRSAADRGRFRGDGVAYFTTGPVLLRRQVVDLSFPVQGKNTTSKTVSDYAYDVPVTIPER